MGGRGGWWQAKVRFALVASKRPTNGLSLGIMPLSRVLLVVGLGLVARPAPITAQIDALGRVPSRFASAEGVRIHYKSVGTGRTAVVLVHCWACDLNVWREQVTVLDGRVRVLALDLPGHGRSDKPIRPYSMAFFARAVNAVMESAGVEHAVLVGHSMGVPVIREFSRLFPAKTDALVVVDGWLVAPGLDSAAIERQVKAFEGPQAAATFEQMITPMFPNESQAAVRRQVIRTAQATPLHVVLAAMRGMLDPAIWHDDPLKVPTLIVMAKGPNWPAGYRARVLKLGGGIRYEELDGVHHFLMLERPDLFNALLVEFLKDLGVMAG
jgi:pimeloyl-ACP methyl ester carboxylesterase